VSSVDRARLGARLVLDTIVCGVVNVGVTNNADMLTTTPLDQRLVDPHTLASERYTLGDESASDRLRLLKDG
jgi:hypothetical protein